MGARASPLARELCLVYALLIVYATLHPFSGWRDSGISPLAWALHWPAIVLPFDLVLNTSAYVPLGVVIVWAAASLPVLARIVLACALGALLSLLLESLQTYLPSRTPSLADFATNSLGTFVGALTGALLLTPASRRALAGAVGHWFADTPERASGLILSGLWLFAILYPQSILFGHGSLLPWLGPVSGYPFTPAEFGRVESAVTAASLFAAGALATSALNHSAPRLWLVLLFVACACGVRAVSQTILFPPAQVFAWLTPGALRGLAIGALALMATLALPRVMLLTLAVIAATFSTVVVNFAPPNPYYLATVQDLNPGRFLNFNGLTQLVSSVWPFLVALYVPWALASQVRS